MNRGLVVLGSEMGERGIAASVMVVIVIATVTVVGAGVYLLIGQQAGPGSGPSENQPGGGAGATGIPMYSGAIQSSIPSDMKSSLGIPADATCQGYTASVDAISVMDWFKANMGGWTLMRENSASPSNYPGSTIYMQLYMKGEDGAFIFAVSNFTGGQTLLGLVAGPWSLIQGCGGFGGGPPGEDNQGPPGGGTGEDIDWSGAYVFTDPKGDFWLGQGSPPQVIEFPPSDLRNIYVTNDNQYLYAKFEMDGAIPTLPLAHDGDTVRILMMDFVVDSDQNTSTGNIMNYQGGDFALEAWFGSPPEAGGVLYTFVKYALYDPAAGEGVGTWKNGTLLAGGAGENFVAMRFSLSGLNLERGMRVNIFPFAEAESDLYHHFARDVYPAEKQWTTNIEIR